MANWETLKSAITSVIKENNNQEITGDILQNVLTSMVSSLGENATFVGLATPSTNPGVLDGTVFYFATEAGTYANFSGITITESGLYMLLYDGTSWSTITLFTASTLKTNAVYSYNTVTSLTDVPVDKPLVIATVDASATMTLSDYMTDGQELHVIINNSSSNSITITLPDSNTLDIGGNSYGEVNIIYVGETQYIRSV